MLIFCKWRMWEGRVPLQVVMAIAASTNGAATSGGRAEAKGKN